MSPRRTETLHEIGHSQHLSPIIRVGFRHRYFGGQGVQIMESRCCLDQRLADCFRPQLWYGERDSRQHQLVLRGLAGLVDIEDQAQHVSDLGERGCADVAPYLLDPAHRNRANVLTLSRRG